MKVQRKGAAIALATILLATLGFRHYLGALAQRPSIDIFLEHLPRQLGQWQGQDTSGLDTRSQDILKLTKYIQRSYVNPQGQSVFVYVGYWQKQTGEYQAAKHSPELCLPSNGWTIEREPARALSFPGSQELLNAKRIIGESRGQSHLFYYWFFTGQKNYSEEWQALLTISLQNFFAGRSDGGIIEISTAVPSGESRVDAEKTASTTIESFVSEFYPALQKLIDNPQVATETK